MKRVFLLVVVILIIFALAGCNVAPNVPGVTPYTTSGTYGNYMGRGVYGTNTGRGTYGNYTGRGMYGNYTGRGTYGNNVGKGTTGNNKTGGNLPANGKSTRYVPGSQSYGLR